MVTVPAGMRPDVSTPVQMRFGMPMPQRRLTVLFRFLLVIPQFIVLYFVSLAAFFVVVIGWFAALFTGSLPGWSAEFLSGWLRWTARVDAYVFLLTDQYPPFSLDPSPAYPVDVFVMSGPLNRWAVLFRYFLAIPAAIAASLVFIGLSIFSVVMWVAALIRGRVPTWMFEAAAAAIRYRIRFDGYFYLLTSFQPAQVMGDGGVPGLPPPPPVVRPTGPADPWTGSVGASAPPLPPSFPGATPPPPPPPGPAPWGQQSSAASTPVPPPSSPESTTSTGPAALPSLTGFTAPGSSELSPTTVPEMPVGGDAGLGVTPGSQAAPPASPPPPADPRYPQQPAGLPPRPPGYPPPPDNSFYATSGISPTGPFSAPWVGVAAGPDRQWRLELSSKARTLVVVFFVLGVLGYFVDAAIAIPTFLGVQRASQAVTAQNQTAEAFSTLEQQAQSFSSQGTSCGQMAQSTAAACFEANDARFATGLTEYSQALTSIDYPTSVVSQVAAARSAADQASQTLVHLSQLGPDLSTYQSAAGNSNFQAEADQIDATTRQLSSALVALAPADTDS